MNILLFSHHINTLRYHVSLTHSLTFSHSLSSYLLEELTDGRFQRNAETEFHSVDATVLSCVNNTHPGSKSTLLYLCIVNTVS